MVGNRLAPEPDIILVGAGIMSATLAVFLKELEPSLNLEIFETLDGAAEESSAHVASTTVHHSPSCAHNIGTPGDLAS